MQTIEQIRDKLRHHNLSAVAGKCGQPYTNVWRAVRGDTTKIGYETVKALSDYVEKHCAA